MEGTGRFQLCRTTEIALGDDLYERGRSPSRQVGRSETAIRSIFVDPLTKWLHRH